MAMVKANAYGHDAVECARRLESEGVDWFGVAIPEEGIELRHAGIERPILCLGSFWPGQEDMLVRNRLTPALYDERAAVNLNKYGSDNDHLIDVHVKIDTGMGRVGVRYDDTDAFADFLKQLKNIRVTGLLTHFAAAENPNETDFTNLQIDRFNRVCDAFRDAGHTPEIMDLANSPGAIVHPASRSNMVRLGGALYGLLDDILPAGTVKPDLKPVLSLRSQIAHVKRVPAGESLGYGQTFVTKRDSQIALVPIVGRISMDWTLLDVTDLREVSVDDEVFLICGESGCSVSAADIAKAVWTIGYEITCGISHRVPRIFLGS